MGQGDTCAGTVTGAAQLVQQDSLFGQKSREGSAGAAPGSQKDQAGPAERSCQCSLLPTNASPWLNVGCCVCCVSNHLWLAGCMQAVRVVSKRQLKLVWRDKVLLRGRMLQVRR